ncbi:MAG: lipid A deacylase LpxR family protein [Alphaproteobacteria bacterium]|nr:lipid A deacylase LpxR family protein [Alphaproteobacteria bacterium]
MVFLRGLSAAALATALLGAAPADAQQGDPEGVFTFVIENDTLAGGNSDKHYTNGIRAGWLTPDSGGPQSLWELGRYVPLIDLQARRRMGFAIGHNLYTPEDKVRTDRNFNDRPYGAFLYAGLAYQSQSDRRLDTVELDVGVVGPAALGEEIQNNFHRLIGSAEAHGWHNQLDNEPGFALVFERKWRFLAETAGGYGIDLMPHVSGSIGNVLTYGGAGLTFRIGEDLAVDFGPPRIRPALPGSSSFDKPLDRFAWYLFAGAEARGVARDMFLDGNTFGSEQSIEKRPFVLDVQAGLAFVIRQTRISYTQVWRTEEFKGQRRPDYFGSISISTKF